MLGIGKEDHMLSSVIIKLSMDPDRVLTKVLDASNFKMAKFAGLVI